MRPIVVIDDDDDVRDILVFALENEGYTVVSYANGKLALDALVETPKENLPGLIIVDYLMPEMDGITFINEVRAKHSDHLGKIPLAISSAMGSMDATVSKVKDVVLLSKPMDLDDLLKLAQDCAL